MAVLVDGNPTDKLSSQGEGSAAQSANEFEGWLLQKVREGNLTTVIDAFENSDNPLHTEVPNQIESIDGEGKTPVDLAASLGRLEILQELHKHGAPINKATSTGYTPLHRAAAWNKLNCVKFLVQNDANILAKTKHGETARDIAERYQHNECKWYLEWAEIRQDLIRFLKEMRDTVMEPERILGRLTKDDKNQTVSACQEKIDWAENALDVSTAELRENRREIETFLEHVIHKLNEPPADKGSKK